MMRDILLLLATALSGCVATTGGGPSDLAGNGSCRPLSDGQCFDVAIDGQTAVALAGGRQSAVYRSVDYYDRVGSDRVWYVPEPISATPTIEALANAGTSALGGLDCIRIDVEEALPPGRRREPLRFNWNSAARCEPNPSRLKDFVVHYGKRYETVGLPPGDYLIRITARGATTWSRKTILASVAP